MRRLNKAARTALIARVEALVADQQHQVAEHLGRAMGRMVGAEGAPITDETRAAVRRHRAAHHAAQGLPFPSAS